MLNFRCGCDCLKFRHEEKKNILPQEMKWVSHIYSYRKFAPKFVLSIEKGKLKCLMRKNKCSERA